ncbi:MAG: molybdenum cofactor synthesis domain-containing protein [Halobacteria archaeon]
MEVSDVTTARSFDDGFGKVSLFETKNFFADVYCFEPGEAQEPHVHEDADKLYHVLEGEATVSVGDESMTVTDGEAVLAGAGDEHGVVAETQTRMLVFMAPHPAHTDAEGHSHGHDHAHGNDASFDIGFVTVSSSRDASEDESGDVARELVEEAGHRLSAYEVVTDDADEICDAVDGFVEDCDAVFTSGGTGLTDDDVTVDALRPLFHKEIRGFGEEFRRRSVDEVGTAAILSRATAGVVGDSVVFVLPGSADAVETGVSLALEELGHALGLVRR